MVAFFPPIRLVELDRLTDPNCRKVRELLDQQHGVLVHCEGGNGRSGTVIGAVLISYGIPALEVVNWLDEVHRLGGKSGWPESAWQRQALFASSSFAIAPAAKLQRPVLRRTVNRRRSLDQGPICRRRTPNRFP
jgi:hypothetical protein